MTTYGSGLMAMQRLFSTIPTTLRIDEVARRTCSISTGQDGLFILQIGMVMVGVTFFLKESQTEHSRCGGIPTTQRLTRGSSHIWDLLAAQPPVERAGVLESLTVVYV